MLPWFTNYKGALAPKRYKWAHRTKVRTEGASLVSSLPLTTTIVIPCMVFYNINYGEGTIPWTKKKLNDLQMPCSMLCCCSECAPYFQVQ